MNDFTQALIKAIEEQQDAHNSGLLSDTELLNRVYEVTMDMINRKYISMNELGKCGNTN